MDSSKIINIPSQNLADDPNAEQMSCAICTDFSNSTMQCKQCQHQFCKKCIEDWQKRSRDCPFKCGVWELEETHRIIRGNIEKLKFYCENKSRGCKQVTTFKDFETHKGLCQFQNGIIAQDKDSQIKYLREQIQHLQLEILTIKSTHQNDIDELKVLIYQLDEQVSKNPSIQKNPKDVFKQSDFCPKFHILQKLKNQDRKQLLQIFTHFFCNDCKKKSSDIQIDYTMYCAICDYDRCYQCYENYKEN